MQNLVQHELQTVVKHCQNCSTTGLLVGIVQVNSAFRVDCVAESRCRSDKLKTERTDAWTEVWPSTLSHHGLPGDKAVLALMHPVVTIRKHYMVSAKLRQE